MAKECALCSFSTDVPVAFSEHMRRVHAWDQVVAQRQPAWLHPMIVLALMLLMPIGWAVLGVLSLRHADGRLDFKKTDHLLALLAIPLSISFWFWGPTLAGAPHDDQGLGTSLLLLGLGVVVAALILGARLLRLALAPR